MSGEHWLVVISTGCDDFAVRLFDDEDEAKSWAAECDFEDEIEEAEDLRAIDAAYPVCVRIQRFVNGRSVTDEVVRDLND